MMVTRECNLVLTNPGARVYVENLDLTPIREFVKLLYGVTAEFTLNIHPDGRYFDIVSEKDMLPEVGLFASMLKDCNMRTFSTFVCADCTFDEDEYRKVSSLVYSESAEERKKAESLLHYSNFRIWFSMSLSYTHADGGMNSMTLFTAETTADSKWNFYPAKDTNDNCQTCTRECWHCSKGHWTYSDGNFEFVSTRE